MSCKLTVLETKCDLRQPRNMMYTSIMTPAHFRFSQMTNYLMYLAYIILLRLPKRFRFFTRLLILLIIPLSDTKLNGDRNLG